MFTALANNYGDLNEKINLFVALAPITHLFGSHFAFFNNIYKSVPSIRSLLYSFSIFELYGPQWNNVSGPICKIFDDLCDNSSLVNVPYNDYNNEVTARIQNKRMQSGTSVKQVLHYAEIFGSNVFREFDYGKKKVNTAHYGKEYAKVPPLIDLTNIQKHDVPIAMFVGKQDALATPTDAQWAKDQLGDKVIYYHEMDNVDHSAFNFGRDMSFLNEVMYHIKMYNPPVEETL